MSAAPLQLSAELPWTSSPQEERRFRRLVLVVCLVFLLFSLVMPFLPLPERAPRELTELPPRLAQLLLERQQQPPPAPAPKAPAPEPAASKPEPEKPQQAKKPEPEPTPAQTTEAAREKAAASGLLAFSDQLADLRDLTAVTKVTRSPRKLTQGGAQSTAAQRVEAPSRSIVTAEAGGGSGGIDTAALSRDTGGTQLQSRGTSKVIAPSATRAAAGTSRSADPRSAARSLEEIQEIIDRNKGALFRIYNRALRRDPSLKGKVVLSITIAPSGKVSAIALVSSELSAPDLERKLMARIKLIDFGAREVEAVTTTLPIDFFPA